MGEDDDYDLNSYDAPDTATWPEPPRRRISWKLILYLAVAALVAIRLSGFGFGLLQALALGLGWPLFALLTFADLVTAAILLCLGLEPYSLGLVQL